MKSKNRIILTILTIVVVILTLFILSNSVFGLKKGEVEKFEDVKNLGQFTRYIAYNPNGFLNLQVNDIFNLNLVWERDWEKSYTTVPEPLEYQWSDNPGSVIMTHYSSAMCVYHFQGSRPYWDGQRSWKYSKCC